VTINTDDLLVACATSGRQRNSTAGKDTVSVAGSLPLYSLGVTQGWEILLVAKLFSYWRSRYSGL